MKKQYKSKDVELNLYNGLLEIKKNNSSIEVSISEAIGLIVLMQEIISDNREELKKRTQVS